VSSGAPFCDPPLTHATSVRISSADNDRSFTKCPYLGSANHGGMIFCVTAVFIIRAQGSVSSYVGMEKGAASPGRWQVWQCFCKIGATSLVNVGGGLPGSCERDSDARKSIAAERITVLAIVRR